MPTPLWFPQLPGLTWNIDWMPQYRTIIQESENGRETRQSSQLYPTWSLSLVYSYLRDYVQTSDASGAPTGFTERTALMQFFGQCRGSFTSFLLQPSLLTLVPADSSVQGQLLGVGDGITTAFQMVQTVYGILDIVQNPQGTPTVYVGGVPTTAFTLGTTGIIVFSTPPALGAAISADFTWAYRCRFTKDSLQFSEFMYLIWKCNKVELMTVRL